MAEARPSTATVSGLALAPESASAHAQRYATTRRRAVMAGLALLLLLACSAATSQWHLGKGNLATALGIAFIKVGIVAWVFMGLGNAAALLRVVLATGLAALAVMTSLSAMDFGPRHNEPARWQPPQQLAPALAEKHRPVGWRLQAGR